MTDGSYFFWIWGFCKAQSAFAGTCFSGLNEEQIKTRILFNGFPNDRGRYSLMSLAALFRGTPLEGTCEPRHSSQGDCKAEGKDGGGCCSTP
jgi:hypothetical protein